MTPPSTKGKTWKKRKGLFSDQPLKDALQEKPPHVALTTPPKQTEWINAVVSGAYRFMGIGGGIRGLKTFGCLIALIVLCRIYPRSRWAIVRADLPTLRRNVVPSMEKLRLMSGGFVGELNQSIWTYTCANGSQLILFAEQFQQDPELERWKGLEVNGFDLEDASELAEKSANKAIERAGSYIIPATPEDPEPRQPPPYVFVNFNPCIEWPRKWFYEPWKLGTIKAPYYFLPTTIADNPFVTEDYRESLKYLPPEEYNRFVKGEWDFVDDPRQLIKSEWVWWARSVEPVDGPGRLGADVARYGDDYSTTARIKGNALKRLREYKHLSTTSFAKILMNEAADPNDPVAAADVRVDGVGLGAGTVDYCKEKKFNVTEVISGAKAIPRKDSVLKFKDLRSQMWWEFREKLRMKLFSFDLRDDHGNIIPIPEKLVGDLASLHYEISGDKVVTVESKDDIKERLGRSTDYGDAVVYGAFDFPRGPLKPGFIWAGQG